MGINCRMEQAAIFGRTTFPHSFDTRSFCASRRFMLKFGLFCLFFEFFAFKFGG